MRDCFDRDGRPLTIEEWAKLLDDPTYKRVAETTLEDGTWISTVWIGLDHSFGLGGPPLIFETMIFPSDRKFREIAMRRYTTEAEARRGHMRMVEDYRRGLYSPHETDDERRI